MDNILNFFNAQWLDFARWLLSYVNSIAMLLTVCVVSLYANDVLKLTKGLVTSHHFVIRVACFVLVTAFGFGLIVIWLSPLLVKGLLLFNVKWLPLTVLIAFLILGSIADKKNQL